MTNKTKTKSGPIDVRNLTTYSRATLGEAVQAQLGTWELQARKAVPQMVDNIVWRIAEALESRQAVRLKKVGCLNPSFKTARLGRNPKTLEEATIKARWTVSLRKSVGEDANGVLGWTDMVNHLLSVYAERQDFRFHKEMARELLGAFVLQIARIEQGTSRIELRGVGSFYPSFVKGRTRRNPKNGQPVDTDDKIAVRFKLSTLLQNKLNADLAPESKAA